MRWQRVLAVSFSAVILAGACAQTGTTTASPTPAAAATTAAPQRGAGGELKILYWQAPTILNPHLATGTKDSDASRLVLEPLASYGPDAKPVAVLAAEIPTVANGGVSADFTTVTWKLKTGVKWSDGTPFTADDVAFTFTYMMDPKTATTTSDAGEGVKSVVAKDASTVVVTYNAPNPNVYQWGVGYVANGGIIQKAQFGPFIGEKAKDAPGNLKPIGTGPYVVTDFKPGDVVTYAANPNFRDPNKPFFKTVNFKGGGDAPSSARAVFQTGDVDYGWNLQVESAVLQPMIASSTKGKMLSVYGSSVERIVVNFSDPNAPGDARGEPTTKHPFFNGPDGLTVRKALALATDRKSVAQQLYGDGLTGKPGCNIITGVPDYESTATTSFCSSFDTAAAAKMLDDAGWKMDAAAGVRAKGGIQLKILYRTTVNAVRQKTQDIMKANWEKAGFKVELASVPASTFFTNTSPDGANHFWSDVEMYTNNSDPDPTSYLNGWTSKQATAKANNWQSGNYGRYQNPAFDTLVDQLRKETDPAKRATLIKQANDILILDVVIMPIVTRTNVTSGVSTTLKGVNPSGWDSEMWNVADWSK